MFCKKLITDECVVLGMSPEMLGILEYSVRVAMANDDLRMTSSQLTDLGLFYQFVLGACRKEQIPLIADWLNRP